MVLYPFCKCHRIFAMQREHLMVRESDTLRELHPCSTDHGKECTLIIQRNCMGRIHHCNSSTVCVAAEASDKSSLFVTRVLSDVRCKVPLYNGLCRNPILCLHEPLKRRKFI